jgi:hypothetical protein
MPRRLTRLAIFVACLASPELIPAPAAPAPAAKPNLAMKRSRPPVGEGQPQCYVFEGTFPAPIHRAGPEHFRLTRASDGAAVGLTVAYDREALEADEPGCPRAPKQRASRVTQDRLPFNSLFKGVRLSLDTGACDAKDERHAAGELDLYGRAKLEPGRRYCLTWACWPVGAKEAAEASCEFEVAR